MASVILPTATLAQLTILATHAMALEADVNGVWNAILTHWFPINALQNAIKPEAHVTDGFVDLLITRLNYTAGGVVAPWRVVYEGKALTGEGYDRIVSQLSGYAKAGLKTGDTVYCIGAHDRTCMFWKFKKGDLIEMKGMKVERGAVVVAEDGAFPSKKYDIINDEAAVQVLLTYVQTHT